MRTLLYKLGRFLQVVGMILLPLAVAGNLVPEEAHRLDLRTSLSLSAVGIAVFAVGWLLQQSGRPS